MNKLVIISAPSGCGKTSLVKALLEKRDDICVSISHTTRDKRAGDKNGVDYHFISENEFKILVKNDEFIEWAKVFNNFYGTSKNSLQNSLKKSSVIVEIDWQGAKQLKEIFSTAISIFIKPPSIAELENRLKNRGDCEELIKSRMSEAESELSHQNEYDFIIINDDFAMALSEINQII
jgi:guanylate kinase